MGASFVFELWSSVRIVAAREPSRHGSWTAERWGQRSISPATRARDSAATFPIEGGEMVDTVITREGLARLTYELEQLRTHGRREIAERIRAAVTTNANVVESAEYHEARDDQATLERRIAVLEERLALARPADPDGTNGLVDVGERVGVRDVDSGRRVQYELVGALEADVSKGRVSVLSPVGRALVGRRRGEVAVVNAPQGEVRLKILSIVTP
jgi:transcription elongation factor GreA